MKETEPLNDEELYNLVDQLIFSLEMVMSHTFDAEPDLHKMYVEKAKNIMEQLEPIVDLSSFINLLLPNEKASEF